MQPSSTKSSFLESRITWSHRYLMSDAIVTADPSASLLGIVILCFVSLLNSISRPPLQCVSAFNVDVPQTKHA
jgi:hypothetical protein